MVLSPDRGSRATRRWADHEPRSRPINRQQFPGPSNSVNIYHHLPSWRERTMSAIPAPGEHAAGYVGATRRTVPGSRLGLALVVIASAQLMVVLDATIVNVALPHVQRALGFSGSGLEWV